MEIGKHTYGKPVVIAGTKFGNLRIGKYCSISTEVIIFTGREHRKDWVTTYPFPAFFDQWPEAKDIAECETTKGDVIIGNDVWICHGVTILSGVTIGDGAVIGAHAVVTKDVAPYAVVAGNPAREKSKRFPEATIEKLLALKWWNWPEEKIRQNIGILCSPDVEKLFLEN